MAREPTETLVIQLYTSDVQFVDLILGGFSRMSIAFVVDAELTDEH